MKSVLNGGKTMNLTENIQKLIDLPDDVEEFKGDA